MNLLYEKPHVHILIWSKFYERYGRVEKKMSQMSFDHRENARNEAKTKIIQFLWINFDDGKQSNTNSHVQQIFQRKND